MAENSRLLFMEKQYMKMHYILFSLLFLLYQEPFGTKKYL